MYCFFIDWALPSLLSFAFALRISFSIYTAIAAAIVTAGEASAPLYAEGGQ